MLPTDPVSVDPLCVPVEPVGHGPGCRKVRRVSMCVDPIAVRVCGDDTKGASGACIKQCVTLASACD